jgi:hypothetical protein
VPQDYAEAAKWFRHAADQELTSGYAGVKQTEPNLPAEEAFLRLLVENPKLRLPQASADRLRQIGLDSEEGSKDMELILQAVQGTGDSGLYKLVKEALGEARSEEAVHPTIADATVSVPPAKSAPQNVPTSNQSDYETLMRGFKSSEEHTQEVLAIKDPLEAARRTVEYFPDSDVNWLQLAKLQFERRLYQESLNSVGECLKRNSECLEGWALKIKIYEIEGDKEQEAYCRDCFAKIQAAQNDRQADASLNARFKLEEPLTNAQSRQ